MTTTHTADMHELTLAAMHAALGRQTQLSRSGFSVIFAPDFRLNGRADLSGTTGLGGRQLAHAGLDLDTVTTEQLDAYRAWRAATDDQRRRDEARIVVTRIYADTYTGGTRGALGRFNGVRLEDGLKDVIDGERIECLERWEPETRNHGGTLGAARSIPNDTAIDKVIGRLLATAQDQGLNVTVVDHRAG